MNIKQAKEEISNAMRAYFTRDAYGNYAIPIEKQRPVFLMGPPGVGKTAIMEQIAQEMDVALISYSMTHHTRQSALGLPFIETKVYGGQEYSVSEYTMSEIIASVYEMMEKTGKKEGILFLDEINCVSETLAPSMLQFLQYKIFGRHRVPDGWIVVTAGNPPEYNNSVREFDIVTWDRLKRIDVEPDYEVWKEYAYKSGVHPAIITYLDIKKGDFYKIESTVDGKSFVTARGWSDLSDMIRLYEKQGIEVKERLVSQYLQNKKIAKDFSVYYDLFNKYRSDYQVDRILAGTAGKNILNRAQNAKFDERLSLLGLILDTVTEKTRQVAVHEGTLKRLLGILKELRTELSTPGTDGAKFLAREAGQQENRLNSSKLAQSLSRDDAEELYSLLSILAEEEKLLRQNGTANPFAAVKTDFDGRTAALRQEAETVKKDLSHTFTFLEEAFRNGQEMLIFVTELTANMYASRFIGRYGCEEYFKHNKDLLFYERQKEIIRELELLDLDD